MKTELIDKSRQAAIAAVQIYNSPSITFKSEIYVTLMHIAWTYMMHAYYRSKGIEYRYYSLVGARRKFDKTKHKAFKYWELERCLDDKFSPIDAETTFNLKFLIGLRHEIEHQMTTRIDDYLSAKFQACALNFNYYVKLLFGHQFGIDRHLSFSIQFSSISPSQKSSLTSVEGMPHNIGDFIDIFESTLTPEANQSERYAYRLIFVPKLVNHRNQADQVIEFIKSDSPLADIVNKQYALIKEIDKAKYLPKQIVNMMREEGFSWFDMQRHTELWSANDAKNPNKGYGILVAGKHWYWFENWVSFVRHYCQGRNNFP